MYHLTILERYDDPSHGEPGEQSTLTEEGSGFSSGKRSRTAELFGSGGLLSQLADGITDGLWSFDGEGRTTYANKAAAVILGVPVERLIGSALSEYAFPEDREKILASALTPKEGASHQTLRLRRADGEEIWVRCQPSPIQGLDERTVEHLLIVQDVTEQHRLGEAKAILAAIVESSDDAIVSKTLDGIIRTWNKGAERVFGYTAEEIVGSPILRLLPKDRYEEEYDILRRLQRGERVDHFETIRVAKDGRLLDVSVTISPIRNAEGVVVGASKVARDITERRRAEEALREREEALLTLAATLEERVRERTTELEEALREMEGFTYTISHDLRGPLRAIIANCRILEEDYGGALPEPAHRHLVRQADAARRMADLIDDLLRLSRISRQDMHRVEIDLSELVNEIAEEICRRAPELDPHFEIQPGLTATADPTLMRLALTNLLENSVKFVRPGAEARIEVGISDGVYFVRDRGIGFDQAYAEKIFQPFERLHHEGAFPGTGIGLANVRRIIERHGGRAWAEGRPNEGATFYFTLPAPKG